MSVILTTDKYKELGDQYANQALAVYETEIPEALANNQGIAELQEKAENLEALAQAQYKKWGSLQELESAKEQAQAGVEQPETGNTPSPTEKKAREAMQKWGGYKSGGDWLKAMYHYKANGFVQGNIGLQYWDGDESERARVQVVDGKKALAENTGATGGFLVPAEFQARVLSVMQTDTVIRPRANIIRMNRRTVAIPVLNQQGTVSGGASWHGGIIVYYKDEAAALTESSPSWREVELTAHKMTGLTYASNELLADSAVALQDFLMGDMGFPGAIAWRADKDYLQGDGVGKPLGIINSSAAITTGGATGGASRVASNDVQYEDLTAMLGKSLPSSNAIWVANQSVLTTLLNMNGPSGNPSYLWGNAVSGIPNTLLGRPIIFTDKLPALGSLGDIILIDPSYYLIGDRQAITMAASIENKFENDQTTWRATMRHDGQPWLQAPITYQDGTTQVSPFVLLGEYSS